MTGPRNRETAGTRIEDVTERLEALFRDWSSTFAKTSETARADLWACSSELMAVVKAAEQANEAILYALTWHQSHGELDRECLARLRAANAVQQLAKRALAVRLDGGNHE